MRLELLAHLRLQRDPGIEHHPQDADHLELRIDVGVHLLDRVDQVAQAFEREVLALHRHHHAVGAGQAVEGEQAEAGRAVDEDEVVVIVDRGEGAAQPPVAPLDADQLHLGAGELAVGADDVVAALRARPPGFGDRGAFQQDVVDAGVEASLVDPGAHGGVALGIEVDHEDPAAEPGQAGGQIDGGRGLADAAFLIGDAENAAHRMYWRSIIASAHSRWFAISGAVFGSRSGIFRQPARERSDVPRETSGSRRAAPPSRPAGSLPFIASQTPPGVARLCVRPTKSAREAKAREVNDVERRRLRAFRPGHARRASCPGARPARPAG